MSSPVLILVVLIVANLFLKSSEGKRKAKQAKEKRRRELQGEPKIEESSEKPGTIREMLSTMRDEVERKNRIEEEKKRQKEINKRKAAEKESREKSYEDNEYWKKKRKAEEKEDKQYKLREEEELNKKKELAIASKIKKDKGKNDLLRGIIVSEILSKPKSMINNKRSM